MVNNNKNGSDWTWRIEPDLQLLQLKLAEDVIFDTCFKKAEVSDNCDFGLPFSTSDAFIYSLYRDKLKTLPLDQQAQFTLAINATVAEHYLKPQATKSWFFQQQNNDSGLKIKQGDWTSLNASENALYIVLESNESTSKVMLVGKQHRIDDSRLFNQGKVLRVHNDRLAPILYKIQEDML